MGRKPNVRTDPRKTAMSSTGSEHDLELARAIGNLLRTPPKPDSTERKRGDGKEETGQRKVAAAVTGGGPIVTPFRTLRTRSLNART